MQGVKSVTDDEIIDQLRRCPCPAYTTAEVAEFFGMSTQGMRNRLNALHETGDLRKKQPSKRVVLWWVPEDEGKAAYAPPSEWDVESEPSESD
jgi:hypothetical protein